MKKLAFCLAAIFAALPAAAQSVSQPTFWRYAHPGAKVLFGADINSVLNSGFGQRLKQEFEASGFKQVASGQGVDFLQNATRIFVSTPGNPDGAPEGATPPVVCAIQGRFNLAEIRSMIASKGAVASSYNGVVIMRPDKDNTSFAMALVSPQVLLAGDPDSVRSAIDQHASGDASAAQSALYLRAAELASMNDIWFVSESSPAGLAKGQGPAQMLADVNSFEGGISFQGGVALAFHLNAKTPEAANTLGSGLHGLMQLAAMSNQENNSSADLLKKLQIAIAGEQVQLSVRYTQPEVDAGITQLKAGLTQTIAQSMGGVTVRPTASREPGWTVSSGPAAQPVQPVEDPNRPLVVTIHNVQGGTRQLDINKEK